jgi:hydroxymethylbilane synthase
MPEELRLGTRGSQLALWQAHTVASRLQEAGGPPCRIVVIKTSGDRLQDAPLSEIGGKRLFVKEIEDALLREEIDLAVHSSKDMPAMLLESLTIGAVLPREDPLDAIVLPQHMTIGPDAIRGMTGDVDLTSPVIAGLSPTAMSFNQVVAALGPSPSLGTGSVRRIAQLTRLFPQARFAPIRGNLDTRLRKLDGGGHDAIVLAAAGLRRLGMASRISVRLPSSACVPAPGQGIVAIEIRQRDADVAAALRQIDDPVAHAALRAERAVVEALGGGCQTPVGALATPVAPDGLELLAVVVSLDGSRAIYGMSHGTVSDPVAVGRRVGAQLMADGAGDILADAHRVQASIGGIQP